MSGRLSVDLAQLDELITELSRFGQALESVQTDVQSQQNRVHAVWRGVAAEEHAAAHARWRTGSQEMHEALQTMRTIVVTAQENYASAIRANSALWAQ